MEPLLSIVLATLLGGVVSVLAAAALSLTVLARWALRLVSFAVGVLLAVALLNLIPESANVLGPEETGVWVLLGMLFFFVLEKLALWRHSHAGLDLPQSNHQHAPAPSGSMIVLGDGLHNFIDGILIAAAFLQDPALGWATALAVLAHEIPQECGDFMILLAAGYSRRRALLLNVASGAAAVVGGVIGYYALAQAEEVIPYALALSAASFIYIAVADLVPQLQMQRRFADIGVQVLLAGTGVMAMMLLHQH